MRKVYFVNSVSMLFLISMLLAYSSPLYAQLLKSRVITASEGIELPGASVRLAKQGTGTLTDKNGFFEINATLPSDTLVISSIGFKSLKIPVTVSLKGLPAILSMEIQNSELQEVIVSTGYTKISSERATGSFTHLNNELINRSVSTDILSRLEGVSAGLQFYRTNISPHGNTSELRVRGLSTIHASSAPLIVIDNFPYEGDINSINPNDVEDITILKDAAATSIWGVRAGNGVIVITTKQGKYNQKTAVSLLANFTSADKPDLFYNPAFLNAQDLIDFQRLRFQNGGFQQNNWTLLPPAVEIQIAAQQGKIGNVEMERQLKLLATKDVRKDMLKYLYQTPLNQQYCLNISGGNNELKYVTSLGFDKNLSANVGFSSSRITLNNQLNYRLGRKLEVFSSLYYALQAYKNNGIQPSALIPREGGALQSYTALIDEHGLPAAIPYKYRQTYIDAAESSGLLNWAFKPLEELNFADNTSNNNEIRINTGLRYSLLPDLALDLKYQFRSAAGEVSSYYAPETYYVRDLINRFTQPNGVSVIPLGGILSGSRSSGKSHYGRLQLNYHKSLQQHQQHQLDALAGAEIREDLSTAGPGYLLYGYDNQTLTSSPYLNYETSYPLRPRSASRIPNTIADVQLFTDRYISYFANAAYTFDQKYTLTLSSRWDASNIFGVATNQKGVPLWSVGALWNLKQEYLASASSNTIDVLKLRATYGVNGNINKQVSTMPSVTNSIGTVTNLPAAQLLSIGNPSLRWEKVSVWNTALDFSFLNGSIRGSLEYYQKAGSDLIGYDYLDPTTGIFSIGLGGITNIDSRINAASMLTKGMDVEITGLISNGKFKWSAVLLASWVKNRITKYSGTESPSIQSFFPVSNAARAPAREGKSADVIYALPWYGLNPATGAMLVYSNNELNENYAAYWSSLQTANLQEMGVTVPQYFGSFRNTLRWKGLSLSVNVVYKAGYNFRRSSINYTNLINYGNKDYLLRWKAPGDELHTTVPALTMRANTTRENIYLNNETMIENAAHIRFKDINLSYKLSAPTLGLSNVSIFLYVNNVGMLWRANKVGLDPDFPTSDYPPIRTYSLGFKMDI
ncbi:SusC/RagA family TonB-linked outer membrane protein [Arcicella sp. DC2W]|uniref:SusC/RagA family TonB-linked outer membrane protein n=1 Tax=Arcicella gelida TaxID=2984195 RepID=A0ABU5S4A8_9BACT|nr:SusC/RagA family TonB-linked outer membrane protein [Arcicella sp. DC2W]MEA5403224.1 SusC/RagA family TonB-linked outer membrane protein [Arcicella sp. DC2W]